jgi:hypothetical protein
MCLILRVHPEKPLLLRESVGTLGGTGCCNVGMKFSWCCWRGVRIMSYSGAGLDITVTRSGGPCAICWRGFRQAGSGVLCKSEVF